MTVEESIDNLKVDTEKLKPCAVYEEDCEACAGCPCVYYKTESE